MNKLLKVKKVNTLKLACISAFMYGIISLIIFIIMILSSIIFKGQPLTVLFLLFMPIIYVILGFISGLIMGATYNLVSKWFGGIEVEVEDIKKFSE